MIELTCATFCGASLALYRSRFSSSRTARNCYALLAVVLWLICGSLLTLAAQP